MVERRLYSESTAIKHPCSITNASSPCQSKSLNVCACVAGVSALLVCLRGWCVCLAGVFEPI